MAVRQSATQVTARQRARQIAAAFQEREATLLTLAGEYFVTAGTLDAAPSALPPAPNDGSVAAAASGWQH